MEITVETQKKDTGFGGVFGAARSSLIWSYIYACFIFLTEATQSPLLFKPV